MTQGTLYLVATPIGNLEDISQRALRVLQEADLIACEDTRHTSRLLMHYGIDTPRKSYHEFNEEKRTEQFLQQLREGMQIALVSDSGTPLVSDPGYDIVFACRREGIRVVPVPGASAAVAAVSFPGGWMPLPLPVWAWARVQTTGNRATTAAKANTQGSFFLAFIFRIVI